MSKLNWQCSGCIFGFRGDWQKKCPSCGREDYWCGSVSPDAKEWKPMGEREEKPNVRYGVTFNNHGRRVRLKAGYDAGKVFVTTSRMTAMAEAVKLCRDHEEPRIVKLTTKKEQPVKSSRRRLYGTGGSSITEAEAAQLATDFVRQSNGKRIRITLEELADS